VSENRQGTPATGAPQGRRFHLQERLGSGAFGDVYLAEQDSGAGFRRRVALKVLNASAATMAEAGRRMRDEARILGRLSHRNIVTVLDLVRLGEQWAVVMDYVPGTDVDRLIEALEKTTEPCPVPAALEMGAAICEALDAAFNADDGKGGTLGVLHRDIKPSNVLLTKDGDVKVLDFGVARVNLETRESKTGIRVGTERYMSPQRIVGEEDGLSGDVYAVAATVAELILRRPIGRTPVIEEKHQKFLDAAMTELEEKLADAPADAKAKLVELLRRALDAEEAPRPSAREMADACLDLSRGFPGDSLAQFARRAVPRVDEILGSRREPVEGVLSEAGSRTTSDPATTRTGKTGASAASVPANVTRMASDPTNTFLDTGTPSAAARRTDAPSRGLPLVVVLGLVGVALVVLGGGGVVALLGAGLLVRGGGTDGPPPAEATVATPIDSTPVVPPTEGTGIAPDVAPPAGPPVEVSAPVEPTTAPTETKSKKTSKVKPPEEPASPAVDPNAPRINRALVVVKDASSIEVTCGDVSATGTASARIADFPAGTCRVRATYLGQPSTTEVVIDRPREVTCTAAGGALSCN
jgi:serine/threonine-protein kinase